MGGSVSSPRLPLPFDDDTSTAPPLSGSFRALELGDLELGSSHWKFDYLEAQRMLGSKLCLGNAEKYCGLEGEEMLAA